MRDVVEIATVVREAFIAALCSASGFGQVRAAARGEGKRRLALSPGH
jgi:hypothetical protein